MMNSEISKLLGSPKNISEGEYTRSDNAAGKGGETGSLGSGEFLPDRQRLGYMVNGVEGGRSGRSGPTGNAGELP